MHFQVTSGERYWRVWISEEKWWCVQHPLPMSQILMVPVRERLASKRCRWTVVAAAQKPGISTAHWEDSLECEHESVKHRIWPHWLCHLMTSSHDDSVTGWPNHQMTPTWTTFSLTTRTGTLPRDDPVAALDLWNSESGPWCCLGLVNSESGLKRWYWIRGRIPAKIKDINSIYNVTHAKTLGD